MTNALIIGGDGKLGAHLCNALRGQGAEVIATSRRQDRQNLSHRILLDLEDKDSWSHLPEAKTVYICAGITSVVECETKPVRTWNLNVENTAALAEHFSTRGSRIILISTNRVFDGSVTNVSADLTPCPTTEYGRQKVETENRLLALPNSAILRVSKVMFPNEALIDRWRTEMSAGRAVQALAEMYQSPVMADLTVQALLAIGQSSGQGIYQLSAQYDLSYHEIALWLAHQLGVDEALVDPQAIAGLSALSKSGLIPDQFAPRHTALDCARLQSEFGFQIPTVEETLHAVNPFSQKLL